MLYSGLLLEKSASTGSLLAGHLGNIPKSTSGALLCWDGEDWVPVYLPDMTDRKLTDCNLFMPQMRNH